METLIELPTVGREETIILQGACVQAGIVVKVDGVFGPKTAEAVLQLAAILAAQLPILAAQLRAV